MIKFTYAVAVGGFMVGMFTAAIISNSAPRFSTTSVYLKDLNNDGRADVVVERKDNKKYIFLQQENGSYLRLDKLKDQQSQQLNEKFQTIEEKVN